MADGKENSIKAASASKEAGPQNVFWPGVFGVAGFLDFLSIFPTLLLKIPIVGWIAGPLLGAIIAVFGGLGFWLYFYLKGYPRFLKGIGTSALIEAAPILGSLPAWLLFAAGAYFMAKFGRIPGISGILSKLKAVK